MKYYSYILEELKSAVIIHGNEKYEHLAKKYRTYETLEKVLRDNGINDISHDPGKDFTEPKEADIWISFSRGGSRQRFGSDKILKVTVGDNAVKNRLINDKEQKECIYGTCIPKKDHFIVDDKMQKKFKRILMKHNKPPQSSI